MNEQKIFVFYVKYQNHNFGVTDVAWKLSY